MLRGIGRCRAKLSGPPRVATPTFSPVAGEYGPTQNVTISCSTGGASIYYTTDGSTPTSGGTLYSTPVAVAATTTLKAIAIDGVILDSNVATATYTINGAVATPSFSPAAGSYGSTQSVTISTATSGATIRYTTDGSTPDGSSTVYSGAISVATTQTVKAIGIKTGYSNSAVGSAAYTIGAFSPVDLFGSSEAGGWWDPSDSATMWQDTAGTTPAAVGDPVGRMDDKSGNGYHFIQATSTSRPILRQDGSSNYYLEFDGTDDWMYRESVSIGGNDIYGIAGLRTPASVVGYERIYTSNVAGSNDWGGGDRLLLMARASTIESWGVYQNSAQYAYEAVAASTLAVIEAGATASATFAAENGGTDATGSTGMTTLAIDKISLGGSPTGTDCTSARFFGGVMIDRIPTSGERADLVTYINGKTGAF